MRKQKKLGVIKAKVKRGDEVVFISGKEFNRYQKVGEKVERVPYTGKVIAVDPKARKVKVDGAMIVKKHRKANPQMNVQGGIIKQEAWVDISNIALLDPKTGKPTRVKLEVRDGEKVRVAKSGEIIPSPSPFERVETKETEESVEETTEDSVEEVEAVEEEVKEEKKVKPKKKKSKKADTKADEKKSEDKSEEE